MPKCSIIIPVYNKANLTRQCLNALFDCATATCPFEVIVVDDGSRDSTPRMLAGFGDRVRVVTHERNKAFATSCNDGAAVARGEYLVFLNNDTIPLAGWLDALVGHAADHPRAGLIGSKLLFPDGTIQHAGMAVCQDRQPRHIYVGFPADHPAVNKPRRMQAVTGACVLLPRELFARAGGFDATFINGYEDVDLCLRVAALGYEVHYCPASVLVHLESVSEGRFKHEAHSAAAFHRRWAGALEPDDLRYFVEDGLIKLHYHVNYVDFTIAPELGVVNGGEEFARTRDLLARRAEQVYSLVRENVHLRAAAEAPVPLPAGVR